MTKRYYDNREISWLKFNKRVLEEAMDPSVPLMERLTFVSIFQSNLDEFFMVRVGSLYDQMIVDPDSRDSKTNMTPEEEIKEIVKYTKKLNGLKDDAYNNLMREVKEFGIELVDFHSRVKCNAAGDCVEDLENEYSKALTLEDEEVLEKLFDSEIRPLISPQIIGKRQPFPFLKEKEIYAIVSLEGKNGTEKLGIVPCSGDVFERLIQIPSDKRKYILAEELILHFVTKIFKKYKVKSKSLIRITRNADIDEETVYDEDLDYRDTMKKLIKKRKKLAPVRMEMSRELNGSALKTLRKYVGLDDDSIFYSKSPLEFSFVRKIQDKLRNHSELFYEKRVPQKSPDISSKRSIIEQIEEKDKLLYYPYNSMKPFLDMLYEASEDPTVVSIKMTLYRLSSDSKIVDALSNAVENGKEVVVLVELRARFDEENNINWSRRLEKAGCRVIYGLPGLKVHSKLCLITRKTDEGIKYITQIGTGNYNEKTAKLYTDYCLMTADKRIAHEAGRVFDRLSLGEVVEKSDLLLVSPLCLRQPIMDMIDNEIVKAEHGAPAYIGIKMNSLTDKGIMNKLIEASRAGVKVQLIVRGICCLIPGVEGITENIEVISIVGRYLEHTRVYIFGEGCDSKVYIGSADLMSRNTMRRVEVATPILDPDIKKRILEDFAIMYTDNVKARKLLKDGTYKHVKQEGAPLNSQEYFFERAYKELEMQDK
ncbi:polyphosphate kinase 1 [Peptoclostridium sp. AF21-18]|uniref:polyphosphate kinase 1 n=1 Tax=Peptoclostridium sp. AF21-18 TaxID=2292243 RepID=UPI000E484645|nr:polyphosphate kinase 1 [Peptoclostridium sp. AF21-18]RHQ96127.1 polyphosphate kinase 1 [Peptoclostridium sp. AF21-18]